MTAHAVREEINWDLFKQYFSRCINTREVIFPVLTIVLKKEKYPFLCEHVVVFRFYHRYCRTPLILLPILRSITNYSIRHEACVRPVDSCRKTRRSYCYYGYRHLRRTPFPTSVLSLRTGSWFVISLCDTIDGSWATSELHHTNQYTCQFSAGLGCTWATSASSFHRYSLRDSFVCFEAF